MNDIRMPRFELVHVGVGFVGVVEQTLDFNGAKIFLRWTRSDRNSAFELIYVGPLDQAPPFVIDWASLEESHNDEPE